MRIPALAWLFLASMVAAQPATAPTAWLPSSTRPTTSQAATRPAAPLPKGAIARLGELLCRHGGRVSALAFSPDGRMLLSAGEGRVRLWDAATGRQVRALVEEPNPGYLSYACFVAGGKAVLASVSDKSAGIWNVDTGKRTDTLTVPGGNALVLSPDGGTLALSPDGQTLRLWDVKTRSERKPLGAGYNPRFSGDGKRVAADGGPRRGGVATAIPVSVYDTSTGQEVRKINVENATPIFTAVALSGDGKLLAVCSQSATVGGMRSALACYDVDAGTEVFKAEQGFLGMAALLFSSDGKVLALVGQAGVSLYNAANGKSLDSVPSDGGMPACAAFSPDSRMLAVANH